MKIALILVALSCALNSCRGISPDEGISPNALAEPYVAGNDTLIGFEADSIGSLPIGFSQTATGEPQIIDWKVVDDNGNRAAAQMSANSGDYYNLLVLDKFGYRDFAMSVKIKAVAGNQDQGGGLVWRYVNEDNYYLARFNPLEGNLRLYRVANGKRRELRSVSATVPEGEWFWMGVEMDGDRITVRLGHEKLIETSDHFFTNAGGIGLWTKADAQTWFDNLGIAPIR